MFFVAIRSQVCACESSGDMSCSAGQLDAGTECFDLIHGAPSKSARVAIASVWDGGRGYECAIPLWCQGATRLTWVIPDSELVLLSPKQSEDCLHAVHIFPTRTTNASASYLRRHRFRSLSHTPGVSGSPGFGFDVSNLLKVAFFSLERQYELLLYADLDIDLRPRKLGAKMWAEARPARALTL